MNRVWCRVSFLFFLFFFVKTHRTNEGLAINELPPRSGKIRGWNWTLCRRKREANAVVTVNSFSRRVKSRSPRFPARTARDTRETRVYFTRKEKEREREENSGASLEGCIREMFARANSSCPRSARFLIPGDRSRIPLPESCWAWLTAGCSAVAVAVDGSTMPAKCGARCNLHWGTGEF